MSHSVLRFFFVVGAVLGRLLLPPSFVSLPLLACLLYCLIRNGAEGQSYSADVKKVHLDGMRFSLLFEKQVNRLA